MAMAADDSFKRPGAVPFKWEISPGIPKPSSSSTASSHPQKLNPPPVGPAFSPSASPLLLRHFPSPSDQTFRVRRRHIDHSSGCFPVPPLNRKKTHNPKMLDHGHDDEDDCSHMIADLQTLARWSMSSRKSLSPDSPPLLSSLSRSLRRAHDDPDWAGYGLF
ncbi:uncharacterized protein [Aristolochia californica]|uniref:uncharacterized protein n=1 Tax=Aristolochia californica TaxID=171875 RepID=UPI0035D96DA8